MSIWRMLLCLVAILSSAGAQEAAPESPAAKACVQCYPTPSGESRDEIATLICPSVALPYGMMYGVLPLVLLIHAYRLARRDSLQLLTHGCLAFMSAQLSLSHLPDNDVFQYVYVKAINEYWMLRFLLPWEVLSCIGFSSQLIVRHNRPLRNWVTDCNALNSLADYCKVSRATFRQASAFLVPVGIGFVVLVYSRGLHFGSIYILPLLLVYLLCT